MLSPPAAVVGAAAPPGTAAVVSLAHAEALRKAGAPRAAPPVHGFCNPTPSTEDVIKKRIKKKQKKEKNTKKKNT